MSRFHSKEGLYFERLPDGSVSVFVRGSTFTASEWASVMASVSARGETGPVHTEAVLFHEKGVSERRSP